ncbi:MAG: ATP-binding protein [Bacteroidales bacterium]|nr:ATP-binding protein [Bacteroidales bacterium]
MQRKLYSDLLNWKKSSHRRPLILFGARQVGKTWLLQNFGSQEYSKTAFISFDRDEAACVLMQTERSAEKLLRGISALTGVDVTAHDTLVILDEVQDCPEALTRLKVFAEDTPDVHIVACGSLLGIAMHEGVSFPVGKVDELTLYPMDFSEFVMASGRDKLYEILANRDWNLLNALSREFVDLLRLYYYVGGMPAAVKSYFENRGLNTVREIQNQILADYERDFSKHASSRVVPRIRMVWQNIVPQLAKENKKFVFGALRKGSRASDYEEAIQWLIDAGIVYRANRVASVKMPLKFYEEREAFKLFIFDVGLLGAMANVPAGQILVADNIFKEYKGAFTEVYVCSQLMSSGVPVFYHSVEKSRIELDFVIQLADNVYPVEVKAEENVRAKSMKVFIDSHQELTGIRLSMRGYERQPWVENIPLYAFADYLSSRK